MALTKPIVATDGVEANGMTRPPLNAAAYKALSFFLQTLNNLSDLPDKPLARTNLGLGTAATKDVSPDFTRGRKLDPQAVQFKNLGDAAFLNVNEIQAALPTLTQDGGNVSGVINIATGKFTLNAAAGSGAAVSAGALVVGTGSGVGPATGATAAATWDGAGIGVGNGYIAASGGGGASRTVVYGGIVAGQTLDNIDRLYYGPVAVGPTAGKDFFSYRCNVVTPGDAGDVMIAGSMQGEISAVTTSIAAADYAEWFESSCGDIPPGTVVGLHNGLLYPIPRGQPKEDIEAAIGVIRPRNTLRAIKGNCAEDHWHAKYLEDAFGDPVYDENGARALNPDWNPDLVYIPRSQRPEWNLVGLVGQVEIADGQPAPSRWVRLRAKPGFPGVSIWLIR